MFNYENKDRMTLKEKEMFMNYTNYLYWQSLRKNKHANTVTNHKKNFVDLLQKYNLDTIKLELNTLLENKFKELFNS